jgi:hypothetical protein
MSLKGKGTAAREQERQAREVSKANQRRFAKANQPQKLRVQVNSAWAKMRPWYPVLLLVAVFSAVVVGVLLIRLGSPANNSLSRTFVNTNQFDEFSVLVAGLLGLSVAVAGFTWPAFWRIKGQVARPPRIAAAVLYAVMSIIIIAGPLGAAG